MLNQYREREQDSQRERWFEDPFAEQPEADPLVDDDDELPPELPDDGAEPEVCLDCGSFLSGDDYFCPTCLEAERAPEYEEREDGEE